MTRLIGGHATKLHVALGKADVLLSVLISKLDVDDTFPKLLFLVFRFCFVLVVVVVNLFAIAKWLHALLTCENCYVNFYSYLRKHAKGQTTVNKKRRFTI